MAKPRLLEQAAEIEHWLKVSGLSPEEMAREVAIAPGTMRVMSKGYQKASEQLIAHVRAVARLRMATKEVAYPRTPPDAAELRETQAKLGELAKEDADAFRVAKGVIYKLQRESRPRLVERSGQPISSAVGERAEAASAAAKEIIAGDRESSRSPQADAPSGERGGPSRGVGRSSRKPPGPPKPAPGGHEK